MSEQTSKYYNIIDYAADNQYEISELSFNEIDGLVLSQLANIKFSDEVPGVGIRDSVTIKEAYTKLRANKYYWEDLSLNKQKLFENMAASKRFMHMSLSNYAMNPAMEGIDDFHVVSENAVATEQFSAVTVSMDDGNNILNYMAFGATDGSLTGWNENFAMLYEAVTQAQADAMNYMNVVTKLFPGSFIGGGHSKGGNNFSYGYMYCNDYARNKIKSGYLYDSPGVNNFNRRNKNYEKLQQITKGNFICPQNTIVGTLLNENSDPVFIHSMEDGFMAHDPFTWLIEHSYFSRRDDIGNILSIKESWRFAPDEQTDASKKLNWILDKLVSKMSATNKKMVVDLIKYILFNSGADKIDDFYRIIAGDMIL